MTPHDTSCVKVCGKEGSVAKEIFINVTTVRMRSILRNFQESSIFDIDK